MVRDSADAMLVRCDAMRCDVRNPVGKLLSGAGLDERSSGAIYLMTPNLALDRWRTTNTPFMHTTAPIRWQNRRMH